MLSDYPIPYLLLRRDGAKVFWNEMLTHLELKKSFYRIVKVVHSWLHTVPGLLKKLFDVVLKRASREKGYHFSSPKIPLF